MQKRFHFLKDSCAPIKKQAILYLLLKLVVSFPLDIKTYSVKISNVGVSNEKGFFPLIAPSLFDLEKSGYTY